MRAERFEVVDAEGRVRAVLGPLDDSGATDTDSSTGSSRGADTDAGPETDDSTDTGTSAGAGSGPTDEVLGLELRDRDGRPRATLGLSADGPWLIFELGGNLLVHVGVDDPGGDAVDPGAFLYLSDRDGSPVLGWRVTDRGTLYATDPRGPREPGVPDARGDDG